MGELEGETGDADSSDEESETDSARPRRVLMGMGLLWGTSSGAVEAMVRTKRESKEEAAKEEKGAAKERSFRCKEGSDAVYESRTWVGD